MPNIRIDHLTANAYGTYSDFNRQLILLYPPNTSIWDGNSFIPDSFQTPPQLPFTVNTNERPEATFTRLQFDQIPPPPPDLT